MPHDASDLKVKKWLSATTQVPKVSRGVVLGKLGPLFE